MMHEVVQRPISLYGFADDHKLRDQFKANDRDNENASISTLENSADDLKTWMDENRLRMNSDKTEFIMFGSKVQLPNVRPLALLWMEVSSLNQIS